MAARAVDGGAMLSARVGKEAAASIRKREKMIKNTQQAVQIIEQHVLPFMPATLGVCFKLNYFYVSEYVSLGPSLQLAFKTVSEKTGDIELGTVIKVRDALIREGWSIPIPDPRVETSEDKLSLSFLASKSLPKRRSIMDVLRRRRQKQERVDLSFAFTGLNETDRCHIEKQVVYVPGRNEERSVVVCDE